MATTVELFANNAETTLAGAITSTALSLNVSPGSGVLFPNPNNAIGQFFRLSLTDATTALQHEIMYVTAVTTDNFTVIRGQEGTTAQAWSAGDICMNAWTAGAAANTVQQSQVQLGSANYFLDTGASANVYAGAPSPANLGMIQDGVQLRMKVSHTNTGASTLTLNGGTSYPIVDIGGQPLSGGELPAGHIASLVANTTGTARYVLMGCESGSSITRAGIVGSVRNLVCDIPAPAVTATFTVDEIIVETALGGERYCLANFNKTINISLVGIGGMDVAGLPSTSNVAIYAAYNPTTGISGLFGFNASSVNAPSVYGGANAPAGFTATALVGVLLVQTGQFIVAYVQDRHVTTDQINQITTGGSSITNANLVLGVPINAKTVDINITFTSTGATNANVGMGATNTGSLGTTSFQVAGGSGSGSMYLRKFALRTAQNIWYSVSNSAGSPQTIIALTGYDI